jgi:hypothetical protein
MCCPFPVQRHREDSLLRALTEKSKQPLALPLTGSTTVVPPPPTTAMHEALVLVDRLRRCLRSVTVAIPMVGFTVEGSLRSGATVNDRDANAVLTVMGLLAHAAESLLERGDVGSDVSSTVEDGLLELHSALWELCGEVLLAARICGTVDQEVRGSACSPQLRECEIGAAACPVCACVFGILRCVLSTVSHSVVVRWLWHASSHQTLDVLIPVVNRLQPSRYSGDSGDGSPLSSDRWIAWQMFSCHTAFHRSSLHVHRLQRWYRQRLRRFVVVHRDRVLDVVSGAAELESDVLQVHYSDLSPFLVRPTQVEMERLVRSETQRRVQQWEKVRLD